MTKDLIVVHGNHDRILAEQVRKMIDNYNSGQTSRPRTSAMDAHRIVPGGDRVASDTRWQPDSAASGNKTDINLEMWSKATWDAQVRAGDSIKEHILFLDIDAGKPTAQIADMTNAGHGIRYGYMGNRAAVSADTNAVFFRKDYVSFLNDLMNLDEQVPDALKQEDILAGIRGDFFNSMCLDAPSVKTMSGSREFITDHKRRQMLFYGLMKFWDNDFNKFMGL